MDGFGGLAEKVMIQWHDGEARADRDRVDPAEGIDQRGVFLMRES